MHSYKAEASAYYGRNEQTVDEVSSFQRNAKLTPGTAFSRAIACLVRGFWRLQATACNFAQKQHPGSRRACCFAHLNKLRGSDLLMPENPREPRGNRGCTNANPATGGRQPSRGMVLLLFLSLFLLREKSRSVRTEMKKYTRCSTIPTVTHDNLHNYLAT